MNNAYLVHAISDTAQERGTSRRYIHLLDRNCESVCQEAVSSITGEDAMGESKTCRILKLHLPLCVGPVWYFAGQLQQSTRVSHSKTFVCWFIGILFISPLCGNYVGHQVPCPFGLSPVLLEIGWNTCICCKNGLIWLSCSGSSDSASVGSVPSSNLSLVRHIFSIPITFGTIEVSSYTR